MIGLSTRMNRRCRLPAWSGGILLLFIVGQACGDGSSIPTEAAHPTDPAPTAPTDSSAVPGDSLAPPDSTVIPPSDSSPTPIPGTDSSSLPGIAFGTYNMPTSYLDSIHTGSMLGGPLSPSNIVSVLTATRSKGARLVLKLCKGRDSYVKNADGTFSFTKWKALIDQYRSVNLEPFISDGTILGHFLIDEPHRTVKWGGKIIPQSTIEAMAAYSKEIWPAMPTLVRVVPSWLATAPVTYRHLDAGWLQYAAGKGEVTQLATAEVAAAKGLGLGLVVGVNLLNGGDGSSKMPGSRAGEYEMTATELRKYGTALLNQSYACGFYMWNHDLDYYERSDMKTAMAELSVTAKAHAKTSCRQ